MTHVTHAISPSEAERAQPRQETELQGTHFIAVTFALFMQNDERGERERERSPSGRRDARQMQPDAKILLASHV